MSMSVMQNEVDDCSSLANINSLDCIQNQSTSHSSNIQQVSTISYSSPTDNQTPTQEDPNSSDALITAAVQESLPNSSLMTPDLSTLTDLRLGIGVVSQPDTYTPLPDTLTSLLHAANHFGQGQTQKNNVTATTPCVVQQTAGDNQTLVDTSVSVEESLPANNLQPLLHQRPSELTSSLDSLGLIAEKDNHNLVNSAMVLDVANMSGKFGQSFSALEFLGILTFTYVNK